MENSESATRGEEGSTSTSDSNSTLSFQNYLDKQFSSLKRELRDDLLNSSVQQFKKLKDSSKVRDFKWTSNRKQFEFNSDVLDDIDSVKSLIRNGEQRQSLEKLSEVSRKVHRRNKLIKLADRSQGGWDTVAEYESDDLASDSDDDKRIRRAESRAMAKKKQFRGRPTATYTGRGSDRSSGLLDDSSTGFMSNFRPFRRIAPDIQCFACGGFGHMRSDCPRTLRMPVQFQGARVNSIPSQGFAASPTGSMQRVGGRQPPATFGKQLPAPEQKSSV